jgi:hypothetical protein
MAKRENGDLQSLDAPKSLHTEMKIDQEREERLSKLKRMFRSSLQSLTTESGLVNFNLQKVKIFLILVIHHHHHHHYL